jgi:hypothetical protein
MLQIRPQNRLHYALLTRFTALLFFLHFTVNFILYSTLSLVKNYLKAQQKSTHRTAVLMATSEHVTHINNGTDNNNQNNNVNNNSKRYGQYLTLDVPAGVSQHTRVLSASTYALNVDRRTSQTDGDAVSAM